LGQKGKQKKGCFGGEKRRGELWDPGKREGGMIGGGGVQVLGDEMRGVQFWAEGDIEPNGEGKEGIGGEFRL